jgi:hypothetical protein
MAEDSIPVHSTNSRGIDGREEPGMPSRSWKPKVPNIQHSAFAPAASARATRHRTISWGSLWERPNRSKLAISNRKVGRIRLTSSDLQPRLCSPFVEFFGECTKHTRKDRILATSTIVPRSFGHGLYYKGEAPRFRRTDPAGTRRCRARARPHKSNEIAERAWLAIGWLSLTMVGQPAA